MPIGLKFVKAAPTSRTIDDHWDKIEMGSGVEKNIKRKLAYDVTKTLNIYIGVPFARDENGRLRELLGFSTYPWELGEKAILDGVVLHYKSLPGGEYKDYDVGYTAVHEIGHWLGLYHTFQKGCASPGDEVSDTPYEGSFTVGCPDK
jgi:hypothetical protein